MRTQEAIKLSIDSADMVIGAYLGDMSNADLMKRPHPQCNHINWQIGHLITSEHSMLNDFVPGGMPPLPEGFAAMYSKEASASDDPSKFATKDQLMAALKVQRQGTLDGLAKASEQDLGKETGVSYAPTVASLYTMQGSHWLMHCGQWVVVRRLLGKPVVM